MATNGGVIRWDMINETATEFTTANGISDNYCRFIGCDSSNGVWVHTWKGFDRFDGQAWHPVTDTSKLLNFPGGTNFLLPGPKGTVRYTCSFNRTEPGFDSIVVLASATDTFSDSIPFYYCYMPEYSHVDVAGRLWVPFLSSFSSSHTPWGYSIFDGTSWHQLPDNLGGASYRVHNIASPTVPLDNGPNRFTYRFQNISGRIDTIDCSNWQKFSSVKDSLCIPASMTIDTAGRLWIGTKNGLSRCDKTGTKEYNFRSGPPGQYISTIVEDSRGTLWTLAEGEIALYDGKSWSYPDMKWASTTPFNLSYRMLPSSTDSGGMWLKSQPYMSEGSIVGDGIAYYNGRDWNNVKVYTTKNGLTSDLIADMAMDNNNTLWCISGGSSRSLCKFVNNTWTCSAIPDSFKSYLPQLYIDKKNNLWFIGKNPARFDGSNWQVLPFTIDEGNSGCTPLLEDRKGDMWFGTCSQGLFHYDQTNNTSGILEKIPVSNRIITSLSEDCSGVVWVSFVCDNSTNCSGVWRYDESGWNKFPAANTGFDLEAPLMCDRTGGMWYTSTTNGVSGISRFDGVKWMRFTTTDGLSDSKIRSMYIAKDGDIWFTSNNGISRLKSTSLGVNFLNASRTVSKGRHLDTPVLFAPGFRYNVKSTDIYFDIRGRRVSLHQGTRHGINVPAVSGIYIRKEVDNIKHGGE
jgi:streptogramin lyase